MRKLLTVLILPNSPNVFSGLTKGDTGHCVERPYDPKAARKNCKPLTESFIACHQLRYDLTLQHADDAETSGFSPILTHGEVGWSKGDQ